MDRDMDEFLNTSVSDNYLILPDLLINLEKQRESLKKQVLGLNTQNGLGNEWDEVARETQQTISELKKVEEECDVIQQCSLNSDDSLAKHDGFITQLKELDETIKLHKYLLWIKQIKQLSTEISTHLSKSNTDLSVEVFLELAELVSTLSETGCTHLKEFAKEIYEELRTQLKDALSNQYNGILKAISWPFATDVSNKALIIWKKKENEFSSCFNHLVSIDCVRLESRSSSIPDLEDPLILPLELLLAPLRKRFRYHFYGDRKTNSKDKPEWCFAQVSQWIINHNSFLVNQIQPHLNNTEFKFLNAQVEFTRGLVQELVKKMNLELNPTHQTINDDYLFSHLLDELLLFDKELTAQHSYPLIYPRCICVVQEEKILCRWRNLEKQFAAEKLKSIMESSSAWEPAYSAVVGADQNIDMVPECGERFMLLLASISERYKQISVLLLRLQFLELQIDLLLEFSHDLSHAVKNSGSNPLSNEYIAYLNASSYIASVLKQWGEESFFVELHYYHKFVNNNESSPSTETIAQLESIRKMDVDFAELEGGAFDEVIKVFDTLCQDIIGTITSFCINHLKTEISTYKKNRWHNHPAVSEPQLMEVSPSALNFLVQLQQHLHYFQTKITPAMQYKLISAFIDRLDELFLNHLIFSNTFNRAGSEQMHYDINQVVKPLVADSLKELYSSSAVLRRTCDACCILRQPSSFIVMLQGLLQNQDNDSTYQEVSAILNEKGVSALTLEEVMKLTNLLVD